ncbi:helix-turn-helix transcriptional regulator [Dictyobacter kobayashii]|uniref:Transcriptional regulator n=1 Tax=Dictyobacter kobayashii TaxID=2014872 RepID=A0A402AVF5_9CHLR|nr:helix-turn-helix transcriptional regulator [Dictyobacter kobayashii]GCE23055.1 transcriptional regulator [Dictyobacter kobayashii]
MTVYDEQRREALAEFLRTRRERLRPEDVGLPTGKRRRAPGLRREEVAQLANIGVSWYTSMEQGRDVHPSLDILDSVATALQFTEHERQHLFLLADQHAFASAPPPEEYISPALRRILASLDPDPAYIMGRRWDYLAWNKAAECLFRPAQSSEAYARNIIWTIFTAPEKRIAGSHWEQVAQAILAEFRSESARYAGEEWFKQLVADLQHASPEFRAWWPRHDVRGRTDGYKEFEHPMVGRLLFEHSTLQVPANPDIKIMIYTPVPGTPTADLLQQLIATTAAQALDPVH